MGLLYLIAASGYQEKMVALRKSSPSSGTLFALAPKARAQGHRDWI